MAGGNWSRQFALPMNWASDDQLLYMRRVLVQEVARLKVFAACSKLAEERVGLAHVEKEIKLRGMA